MKVALCLHGLAGGLSEKYEGMPVDFKIGYEHYKKHILDKNDCDVFIHTWSVQSEEEIKKIYMPKKSLFEKQIIFDKPNFLKKTIDKRPYMKHATYSRWYSTKKAIGLKKQYEEENNFRYDCVFISRFDMAFFNDVIFKNYDMGRFYAPYAYRYVSSDGKEIPDNQYWEVAKKADMSKYTKKPIGYPHNNEGLSDLFFFSNSDFMDRFAALYDNLNSYLKECECSSHLLALHHIKKLNLLDKLDFALYRFDDFDLVRRKFFGYVK